MNKKEIFLKNHKTDIINWAKSQEYAWFRNDECFNGGIGAIINMDPFIINRVVKILDVSNKEIMVAIEGGDVIGYDYDNSFLVSCGHFKTLEDMVNGKEVEGKVLMM